MMAAATRLLAATDDEEAVSIRAVAEAVGVTPPSIYLHFADKDELVYAVCEEQFGKLDDEMAAAAAGAPDPVEGLRRRGRAYVRFGLRNAEAYRVLFMRRKHVPEGADREFIRGSKTFENLVEAVKGCLDAGALAPGDPLQISSGPWVMVHGITSLLIPAPGFPWPYPPTSWSTASSTTTSRACCPALAPDRDPARASTPGLRAGVEALGPGAEALGPGAREHAPRRCQGPRRGSLAVGRIGCRHLSTAPRRHSTAPALHGPRTSTAPGTSTAPHFHRPGTSRPPAVRCRSSGSPYPGWPACRMGPRGSSP
jgi:AcrR family transcriptional regulator